MVAILKAQNARDCIFYAKNRWGCIFKEQNLDGVTFLRPFLAGGVHFEKRMLKIVNVFLRLFTVIIK